ncbi:MAG: hypothetical protein ACFFAO_17095 [Candidatus Hermodarchaeota archaeon]
MSSNSFSLEIQKLAKSEVQWIKLLPADPRKYLLESNESFTVYRTLTDLLNLSSDHPDVINAHQEVLEDPQVEQLLNNLSDWENNFVKAHNRADYLPNQLWLLLDWGVNINDDPRMKNAIDKILDHQDEQLGQFLAYIEAYDRKTKTKYPMWSSALCDHNFIVSVLLLAGLKDDERVKSGFNRMSELLKKTTQGWGWKCEPWLYYKRRGPGRVNDVCPMIVADALRGYWILDDKDWPEHLIETGKTLLSCWMNRSIHKPYMFGHGKNFRLPRAPFFWYNIGVILDATSHYPELIKTQAFKELVAVSLIEFPINGKFIPKSIYMYFKNYSFGQKKEPSPWMTLFLSRIYKRAVDADPKIVESINKIDGKSLKGSKGGDKYKNK